ncbi:hypothetical protein [Actinotalea sp. Marseille-Q4924]|uniref:hypothetical protein n=1 Tax=Actinotalea sp. Marseille-Q4924 TaxID=2866571 RepID=UPI001CE46863|nr:hypothetical protein [Actinotalea sp. Marseille-Q4924]
MHEIYLKISENQTRDIERRLQRRLAAEERGLLRDRPRHRRLPHLPPALHRHGHARG